MTFTGFLGGTAGFAEADVPLFEEGGEPRSELLYDFWATDIMQQQQEEEREERGEAMSPTCAPARRQEFVKAFRCTFYRWTWRFLTFGKGWL